MKGLIKLTLLVVALVGFGNFAMGQNVKLGYINTQELISMMPELDSAKVKLEKYSKELEEQSEAIMVEYNKKLQDYNAKAEGMTPAIREQKEKELNDIRTRFQEFQQAAQQDLQQQQMTLMTPVINKAREAIKKVAKANGVTMVFDFSASAFDQQALLYVDEASTINLLPLVKSELRIVAKPQPATIKK